VISDTDLTWKVQLLEVGLSSKKSSLSGKYEPTPTQFLLAFDAAFERGRDDWERAGQVWPRYDKARGGFAILG
jgi:hypothetical protein